MSFHSLLDALAGLAWPSRRLARTGAAGLHPSRLRGMTAEFTEYRLYRQGDDPRRLDWKLLARTDRAYLRITDDHALRTTHLVLDGSASMAFPGERLGKWRQACRLAVGLAAVARGGGDPVGLVLVVEGSPVRLAPRARPGTLGEIVRAVERATPGGSPHLAAGLDGIRAGSRVVLVSDFLGEVGPLLRRAAALAAEGGEVYAVHVIADAEADPDARPALAVDPEDPRIARVLHPGVRAGYIAAFAGWRQALATRFRTAGIEYYEVRDTSDTAAAIRRIVRPE